MAAATGFVTTTTAPSTSQLQTAPLARWLAPLLLALAIGAAAASVACISLLSAARAYVGGESQWSRAQKSASLALLRYAESGAQADWEAYRRAIAVPLGDRRARDELDRPQPDMAVVTEGYVAGANHPDDVPGMARLYRWFGDLPFMAEAVALWREGDAHLDELDAAAQAIRQARAEGAAPQALAALAARVQEIEGRITPLEARFSATLGDAARQVAQLLALLLACGALSLGVLGYFVVRRTTQRDAAAAQALARSEALFRSLWETTSDAVLIVGTDHRMLFANPAAHELFGHPPGALVGQPLSVLQPERLRAPHQAGVARYLASGEKRLDWRGVEIAGLHRDGRELPLEIRFSRFDFDGRPQFVGFLRDITERKRAEHEIQQAQQRLEQRVAERTQALVQANERLLELHRLKSEFLATMSHELRTPLNSILGFADILSAQMAGPLNDEQRRQIGFIHGSGRHLLSLITDLLDLSRIESGRMELMLEELDFAALVTEAVAQLQPLAERKGLALRQQTAAAAMPWFGDRRKLMQVLLNLAGNAVKFTREGQVTIRAALVGGRLEFEVADTGIGIPAERLPELFQAFVQIDGGPGRSHEGTGLGLYLTRKLVDLMGGRIDVDSEAGVGSRFRVVLPRWTDTHLAPREQAAASVI